MAMHAEATFTIADWDEQDILQDGGGPKVTRASVSMSFSGQLEGEGAVEWLMGYDEDGTATFVGLERVVATLGDRSGSFVLQHVGRFDGETGEAEVLVVPGSGTDELRELRATGKFRAGLGPDSERTITLDYEL
jgi:Protein of unknown function (DUF3224)